MSSRIAPLRALPPLCDRCSVAMVPVEIPAIESLRLRGARLLIDKVAAVGSHGEHRVGDGTLFAPGGNERVRRTYGIEGLVMAVGPDIAPDDIQPGDRVIIDEFAGRPIFWNDRRLPWWIVGDSEVMIVLRPGDDQ